MEDACVFALMKLPQGVLRKILLKGSLRMIKSLVIAYPQAMGATILDILAPAVTPATLTITAENQTKIYGAAVPLLTASYSGFVNGDTATSLTTQPTLFTTATVSSGVSGNPYTITASGAVDGNYAISYATGTLTVTPARVNLSRF